MWRLSKQNLITTAVLIINCQVVKWNKLKKSKKSKKLKMAKIMLQKNIWNKFEAIWNN